MGRVRDFIDSKIDQAIAARAQRKFTRVLEEYGPRVEWYLSEPCQLPAWCAITGTGPMERDPTALKMFGARTRVRWDGKPNRVMSPVNDAAHRVKAAFDQLNPGSYPIMQGKPVAVPMGVRAERVEKIRKAQGDAA